MRTKVRGCHLGLLLFLTVLTALPYPVHAALIQRYDLESLCYMSTDVVEATLTRNHITGLQEEDDRFTATVTSSITGKFHPGDKIGDLNLSRYDPNANGQRCILFVARKQFQFHVSPSPACPLKAVDMLLIDSHNRMQRYYQTQNPGGLTAASNVQAPTLHAERSAIAAKWAAVDRLRPLLSHPLRREDIPAFEVLIQARRSPSGPGPRSIIREIAQDRVATLHALSQ